MKETKLKYPIKLNGEKRDRITMRRPTIHDRLIIENIEGSEAQREFHLISNLSEISPDELGMLDLVDYMSLQEVLNDFLS